MVGARARDRRAASTRRRDDRVVVTDRSMTNRHLAVRWDGNGDDHFDHRHRCRAGNCCRRRPGGRARAGARPARPLRRLGPRVVDTGLGRRNRRRRVGRGRRAPGRCSAVSSVPAPLRTVVRDRDLHDARRVTAARHRHRARLAARRAPAVDGVPVRRPRRHAPPATSSSGTSGARRIRRQSWDAAKFEVCAHRYVDLGEPDFGVAVLNNGRYGHGLFDGRVRVSLARAAALPRPDRRPRTHTVDLAISRTAPGLAMSSTRPQRLTMPLRIAPGNAPSAPDPVVALTGHAASRSTPSSSPTTTRAT